MAFFKDTITGLREPGATGRDAVQREPETAAVRDLARRTPERPEPQAEPRGERKESYLGPDLTIDGRIEGSGHVRIAGRFKGDVQVQGDLTIDAGAHLHGQVHAKQVVVGGELHGNIDGATRVELLSTGVLVGDIKAGALVVAAGSRMRGQVEFGWDEKSAPKPELVRGHGPAA